MPGPYEPEPATPPDLGTTTPEELEQLRELAERAVRDSDAELMCRIALANENLSRTRAKGDDLTNGIDGVRGWFLRAARLGHLPAMHELARLAAVEGSWDTALMWLDQVGEHLADHPPRPEATSFDAVRPHPPVDGPRMRDLLVPKRWTGTEGWVGLTHDVLGEDDLGRVVPWDSERWNWGGAWFKLLARDTGRSIALLEAAAHRWQYVDSTGTELPHDWAALHEHPTPSTIHWPSVTDELVCLGADVQGEMPAPQGRTFVRLMAEPFNALRIPALIMSNCVPGHHS